MISGLRLQPLYTNTTFPNVTQQKVEKTTISRGLSLMRDINDITTSVLANRINANWQILMEGDLSNFQNNLKKLY